MNKRIKAICYTKGHFGKGFKENCESEYNEFFGNIDIDIFEYYSGKN